MTRGRKIAGKVAVIALLDRHAKPSSQVRLNVIHTLGRSEVQGSVRENVEEGSTLHTDAFASYSGLIADFAHNVIDHAETYVDGEVHTNNCENFWSLLKRGLHGTYVSVEPFHLFRYLDEQAFRFNNRKDVDAERFSLVVCGIFGRRLTYKDLLGAGRIPSAN
ncbi:MAG: IS1595 family transposase [Thermoanaerobaculia bacterium]